jgi:hypothetical protein
MASQANSPEADELRRQMEEMPPREPPGLPTDKKVPSEADDLKTAWGLEVGAKLYDGVVYGR